MYTILLINWETSKLCMRSWISCTRCSVYVHLKKPPKLRHIILVAFTSGKVFLHDTIPSGIEEMVKVYFESNLKRSCFKRFNKVLR